MGLQIFSVINDEKYSINSLPVLEEVTEIPLSIKIIEEGDLSMNNTEIEGMGNYKVELIDTYESKTTDLSLSDTYPFSSTEGTFNDRFILRLTPIASEFIDIVDPERLINVYSSNDMLYIKSDNDRWSSPETKINIYDMMGRLVKSVSNVSIYNGETRELPFAYPKGVYIVEFSYKTDRTVQKFSKR